MKLLRVLAVSVVVSAALAAFPGRAGAQARPKKLLQVGHENPTPQQFRRDIAILEALPFDGVVLTVRAFDFGEEIRNSCPLTIAFDRTPWKREWFTRAIADLKAVRSRKLTDNFILVNANPGDVDWFDDAGWQQIVDHFRIAAWIAREGRMKGIVFDAEPYEPPYRAFSYKCQPEARAHTFQQYYQKVRQRGREVMQAMVEEYPDITIMTFFMNAYVLEDEPWSGPAAIGRRNPLHALAAHSYGLYPPFIDGWLDAAPPSVTMVDGNEGGYGYRTEEQFWSAATRIKGDGQEVVSPENRAKYRSQVQVGFGIYVDAHAFPEGQYWLGGTIEGRAAMLERNVAAALRAADEYVWLWGERGRWWPDPTDTAAWKHDIGLEWNDIIPGCEQALRNAKDPAGALRRSEEAEVASLQRGARLVNLAKNGGFATGPVAGQPAREDWSSGTSPAEWSNWQEENSKGMFGWNEEHGFVAPGSATIAGVTGGCIIQTFPARPQERYYVSVMARRVGEGLPTLGVGWKTAAGAWMGHGVWERHLSRESIFPEEPGPWEPWRRMWMVVTVPEGAGEMIVMPGVSGQVSLKRDIAWFDDVQVFLLP